MEAIKKLANKSLNLYIFQALAMPFGYFTRILFANRLSATDFGLFYALFEFFTLLSFFVNFGMSETLSYFIPKETKKENGSAAKIILSILIMQLVFFVIISLMVRALSNYLMNEYFNLSFNIIYIDLMIVFFFFLNLYNSLQAILVSLDQSRDFAVADFSRTFLVFVVSFIGISYFGNGVGSVIAFYLISTFAVTIFQIWRLRAKSLSKSLPKLRELATIKSKMVSVVKYGFASLASASAYIFFTKTDILFLTAMQGVKAVGIYSVAVATISSATIIIAPLGRLVLPEISSYDIKKENKSISEITLPMYNFGLFLTLPICVLIFIFSTEILGFLFGYNFAEGSTSLRILSLGFIFLVIYTYNNLVISGLGFIKQRVTIIFLGLIANIALNYFLVGLFGIVGAAIATSISYFIIFLLSFIFLSKKLSLSLKYRNIITIFLMNLIFLPLIFLEVNIDNRYLHALSLILCAGIIFSMYVLIGNYFKIINFKKIKEVLVDAFKGVGS